MAKNILFKDSEAATTYDLSLLDGSQRKWLKSEGLRVVYADIFDSLMSHARSGAWLELGAGVGVFKHQASHLVTSDIVKTPYVDIAVSAYDISASGRRWDTLFAFDMLHHLREPMEFFLSSSSVLEDGGRVVLMEPAATLGGRWFYKMFHHEPIEPVKIQEPYVFTADSADGDYANMGMGWALFARERKAVDKILSEMGLRVVSVQFRDGLAYAATGGFSGPQLLPTGIIRGLLWLEKRLPQCFWRRFGLRMVIVLEKENT